MIDSLTYLISTCAGYEAPLQKVLKSLPGHAHVLVVSGRHAARQVRYVGHRTAYLEVTQGSYDYTAMIELTEHHAEWIDGHVFLLHDTMELGPDSDRLIRQADPALASTAVWGGECNLALYRVDYLHQCRAQLAGLKNCSKLYSVEMEGFLWKQLPEAQRGSYSGGVDVGDVSAPYGGATRQCVRYAGVDLIKWKANWGQIWPPSVVTP